MEEIKLINLIDKEALERIQDGFSKYTQMAAITVDVDGTPITTGSGFTRFCNELTRKSELGCINCEKCDRDGAFRTFEVGEAAAYVCHAGLMDFAAPIMIEGKVIGGFIGGQVRICELDNNTIAQKAIEYGIDPDEYIKASAETSLLTQEKVEAAAKFIEEIASALSLMAYKSYIELKESERMERVARSQADYIMNMSMNLERVMERWFTIIDNTVSKTDDDSIHSLLSSLQVDGNDVKNSINDTISYIKMSANNVEISESEYSLDQLIHIVTESSKPNNISITKLDSDHENLFGDIVKIGQIINKTIKAISSASKEPEVLISSKNKQYATHLKISIIDHDTEHSLDDISKIRASLDYNEFDINYGSDEIGNWLSLEGMLLKNMSGTVLISKQEDNLVIDITIPQLGIK